MMTKWIVTALVILGLSGSALAEDTVTLKPTAYVKGETVLLGEIASIDGPNATQLAQIEVAGYVCPCFQTPL